MEDQQNHCLKIIGDSMSGIVEPGSFVQVDPNKEPTAGFVIVVPLDETDTRRYVRLLHDTTDTDFWGVWRSMPPESQSFRRDQYRCLKIIAMQFAQPAQPAAA
jgi:hypothetical protein